MDEIAALVMLAIPAALIVTVTLIESRRLRRAAQRFRELENERLEEEERLDALPEFGSSSATIGMPDGRVADRDAVLRASLRELRDWPPNRSEGRSRR